MKEILNTEEDYKLINLLEDDWNNMMKNIPEIATFLGNHDYNDKLTDLSESALKNNYDYNLKMIETLKSMDLNNLSRENKINYDLFLEKIEEEIREYNFKSYLMPLNQMDGVQNTFIYTVQIMPFKTYKDFNNYLARLKAFPKYIDQLINLMRIGQESGYTVPKVAIVNVVSQIRDQLPANYKDSAYYSVMENSHPEFNHIKKEIEEQIKESVYTNFNKLADFLENEHIPKCRDTFGLSSLPDGTNFYNHRLKMSTTTNLTATEIHEIGKREVDRIYHEMLDLASKLGYENRYDEFLEHVKTDPKFYFTDPNDLMVTYRDIAKRADKELPSLFKVLPRLPYGVEEIPPHQAPSYPTAYYMPSDMGMTRAGVFYANTHQLEIRPKYEMEALTLHEAVPGHHLQIALSMELDNLPKFRKMAISGYTGYIEGWGLYSEKLGVDMGFYKDPYSKFGQLCFEIWRACRLVVDTGLHAFNWEREKAISYMQDKTGKSFDACAVEVDRYMSIPGQATAYKIGEIKILELKEKFKANKMKDFDIREFHDVILRNGALPLNVLENYVNEHLAS